VLLHCAETGALLRRCGTEVIVAPWVASLARRAAQDPVIAALDLYQMRVCASHDVRKQA